MYIYTRYNILPLSLLYLLFVVFIFNSLIPLSLSIDKLIGITTNKDAFIDKSEEQCLIEYDEFRGLNTIWSENHHMNEIASLLRNYQRYHGIKQIIMESNEEFCQRKFMINTFWNLKCQESNNQGIGNVITQFMNVFSTAILLERTIVLGKDDEFEKDCQKFIKIKKWVSSYDFIKKQYEERCHRTLPAIQSLDEISYDLLAIHNISFVTNGQGYHAPTEPFCMFHPIDGIIDYNTFPQIKSIYNVFFQNDDLGRFEGYGMMFRSFFKFSKFVYSTINPLIQELYLASSSKARTFCKRNDSIYSIGVHLRHQDPASIDDPMLDESFDIIVSDVIQNITMMNPNKRCIVFPASDRLASVERIISYAKKYNCDVIRAPHPITNKSNNAVMQEHGPWSGGNAILDVYLLSHSNYYIGSGFSTFSTWVGQNYVARASFHNIMQSMSDQLNWIRPSVGLYQNSFRDCKTYRPYDYNRKPGKVLSIQVNKKKLSLPNDREMVLRVS